MRLKPSPVNSHLVGRSTHFKILKRSAWHPQICSSGAIGDGAAAGGGGIEIARLAATVGGETVRPAQSVLDRRFVPKGENVEIRGDRSGQLGISCKRGSIPVPRCP
jgi:hypothetical protein